MTKRIVQLTLVLFIGGLWIAAGTATNADEADIATTGETTPGPTPRRRTRSNTNMNATTNVGWNADWTETNMAANSTANMANYALPTFFEPDLPTCREGGTQADQAHLYFLDAQDILEAADDRLVNGDERDDWKRLRREAVRCLTKALALDPSNRTYLLKRADVNDDDPLLVIKDVSKAIEGDPNDTALYLLRAQAYVRASQLSPALIDYNKAISLEPKDADLYIKRSGFFDLYMQDKERALADLNSALDIDPSDATARGRRSDIYVAKNDYPNALKDVSFLIEKFPTFSFYYLSRAEIYEAAGQLNKALADVNAAIKIYPNSYFSYQQRAKLYRKTGQNALAVRDERTAKRLEAQLVKELEKED